MTQQIAGFRLSPQQQHYLSLQQGNPQFPKWSHCVLLCQGATKSQQLVKALNQLIDRHEILRTSYQSLEGMTVPLQVIEDATPLPLRSWHVQGLKSDRTELHQFLRTWPSKSPNRKTGDCLQAALLPIADQKLLVLALPALCADAATWQLLSRELEDIYQKQALPPEPMQYADFAEWQNELLESEETATGRLFWEKSSTTPTALKLPFTIQQPSIAEFTPQCLVRTLAPKLTAQILKLAKTHSISPRSICLTVFQLLLSRLTSISEFELALTLDGRKFAELEEVAGPVTKALPLQVSLDASLPFSDLVQAVEHHVHELEQYQEYFAPTFAVSRIGFDYIEWTAEVPTEKTFQPLLQTQYLHAFELQLTCIQQGKDLYLEWHHDLQRFTDQGIEQIAILFEGLLQSALSDSQIAVKDLAIPSQLPATHPQISPPPFQFVHEWVSSQAELTPERPAVIDAAQSFTYQAFEQRTNQLAHLLVSTGIGPEQRVMIYGDRNIDLIIAIFAILKAGAAYVPVDAGVPALALEQRIETVNPGLVLTLGEYCDCIPTTATVLYLDQDTTLITNQPTTPPEVILAPENLAHIIFTSGSTGKPKGVSVEHRQLTNYIHGISNQISSPKVGHWALASTLAADLGHTILFPCLCYGHCLHILAPERCLDAVAFAEEIQQIDVLKIVPAHLRSLLTGSQPILPKEQIILGGEALDWPLIDQIQAAAPNCQILNHYGPTETTVGVLTHAEEADHPRDTFTVPIGQSLPHAQAYILDPNLQFLPPGLPGTLYIGGQSVSRGYWQQPQLTAATFIPDPFSQQPGARLYNTGDRARYRYDGSIEFLGRQDQQVKIRGFRVELAEIEAVLLQHEAIQEGVVLALHKQDHAQLVAYVVPRAEIEPQELQTYLSCQLPEQMVPTQIVMLKALPKLANGKCDRNTLATQPLPTEKRPFTAPRTLEEQTLAQLWSQVLGQDSISIYDNFFELGGDSILCIQMVGRATQVGLRFTPKQLFEHPTIAELALIVDTAVAIAAEQGLVTGPVPLTPIQHWFFEQQNPDLHHWNQATFLQSKQPIVIEHLEQALHAVLSHHDGLRAYYTLTSEGWQQKISATPPKAEQILSVVELTDLAPDEHASTLQVQASQYQASLNITEGPLIRVVLFNLGPQCPQYLLLVCHHLIIDGVSWRILLTDLQRTYQQLQQGQPIQLPPKTTSFQTWTTRLQNYAQSSALQSNIDDWLGQIPSSPLPQDFDRVDTDLSHQRTQECALSAKLTQVLLNQAPATYQTQINDLLLTALLLTMGQWTGNYHLRLDVEGHGRPDLFSDLDVSRTVGWFTSLYPVSFRLDAPDDLGGSIQQVKATLRQLPPDIGFGLLRYLCTDAQIHKQFQALPSAQIRFNYLGQTDSLLAEVNMLAAAPFRPGLSHAASSRRMFLLDISGIVQSGELVLNWRYSDQLYCSTTIETLAQMYLRQLEALIQHCQSTEVQSEPRALMEHSGSAIANPSF